MHNDRSSLSTPVRAPRVRRLTTGFLGAALLSTALVFGPVAPMTAVAGPAPDGFADLVQKVSPAVVMITTTQTVETPAQNQPIFPDGSPFSDLFKDFPFQNGPDGNGGGQPRQPRHAQALGSGFVISEDGYIVTNNHVIENADEIQIKFYDGTTLDAKLVGTDKKTDIALLKVKSDKPLPFVTLGDSDKARVGDWVLAMGNPLGQDFSASAGIISARNRELSGTYDDYLQTDAAINQGNSGGPLFNMNGDVIGVNTAILSPNGGSIGIGFSMASNVVKKVTDQLKQYGETRRGWLGVKIQEITPDMADAMNLPKPEGALVSEVPDGPAKDAGIKAGDVITSFDGSPVKNSRDLVKRVADAPIDQKVRVTVIRDGKEQTILVTLGRRETAESDDTSDKGKNTAPSKSDEVLGMSLQPMTDDLASNLGLQPGATGLVVTDIDEESQAFDKGLRQGDVIVEAGQKTITTVAELNEQLKVAKDAGRKSILLLVRRDGEPRFVALPVS